jgi:hypothetical protein
MGKQNNKETYPHPSEDTTTRFSKDRLIRNRGWVIHSRPKHGQNIWKSLDGTLLPESEVVKSIPKDLLQDAEYAEDLYECEDL